MQQQWLAGTVPSILPDGPTHNYSVPLLTIIRILVTLIFLSGPNAATSSSRGDPPRFRLSRAVSQIQSWDHHERTCQRPLRCLPAHRWR